MIQYCAYQTAHRLMEAGLILTLSEMAYQVERNRPEHVAFQPSSSKGGQAWVDQASQNRFLVPAPTLCELLQLVPVQLHIDRLGYWCTARYRDAVGPTLRVKGDCPVEAVGELIIRLLVDRRVIVDPTCCDGSLICYP